ncbi:MAG: hypothetical protein BWY08_00755 [Bacteroidetes bacterium ADurb.Bin174]|nr:MAG: hypothetical protein BWY08_00755 [Bacteroidetes bacterium ADurb.Bin174]HNT90476.1 hypothetical protein [Smithellaceae bacterium]HPY34618.1 hypothetical protein [Smithellaceae bacterium]HQB91869.1 hypothetical protein [Smithellaceae bacterium]
MYGIKDLKQIINNITQTTVECPVKDCSCIVERQHRSFRREARFMCPEHKIYISPTTFEYDSKIDNLLWQNKVDLELLEEIKKAKRESRIERDNSEDSLTWNVFRYLENTNQLASLLSHFGHVSHFDADLIYWSYSLKLKGPWQELKRARYEFGESQARGSEPDLIALTDKSLYFIEAKLTATNNTSPSDKNNRKKYLTGGNGWYKQVFRSDFDTVAIQAKKYELFRFWLLGSWLAKEINRNFCLINIVLSERDKDIEERFIPHIIQVEGQRQFKRITWEGIYDYIVKNAPDSQDKQLMVKYFHNKTIGYKYGILQKAFSVSQNVPVAQHRIMK